MDWINDRIGFFSLVFFQLPNVIVSALEWTKSRCNLFTSESNAVNLVCDRHCSTRVTWLQRSEKKDAKRRNDFCSAFGIVALSQCESKIDKLLSLTFLPFAVKCFVTTPFMTMSCCCYTNVTVQCVLYRWINDAIGDRKIYLKFIDDMPFVSIYVRSMHRQLNETVFIASQMQLQRSLRTLYCMDESLWELSWPWMSLSRIKWQFLWKSCLCVSGRSNVLTACACRNDVYESVNRNFHAWRGWWLAYAHITIKSFGHLRSVVGFMIFHFATFRMWTVVAWLFHFHRAE